MSSREPGEIGGSGSSGSSGRDDRDRRDRQRERPELDLDEYDRRDAGRERAVEQQPAPSPDVAERATETIAERRAARQIERRLGRRELARRANRRGAPQTVADRDPVEAAPVDVTPGEDVRADGTDVELTPAFERELEAELGAGSEQPAGERPAREDVDPNLEPPEEGLGEYQQQIDFDTRRTFREQSTLDPAADVGGGTDLLEPAAELEERVANLPGVDSATDRIRSGAALAASTAESAADAVSPVTDPIVSGSRGAADFATENVLEPAVDNFRTRPSTLVDPERAVDPERTEADRVLAEGAEATGRAAVDLTVGLPALAADVTRAGTDAATFSARAINEEGVVRGTETVAESAGDVAAEAGQTAVEEFRRDPAGFAARSAGYAIGGYGVSRAGRALATRARGAAERVNLPDREQFLADERGMAGGQRTITIEEQEQIVGRQIAEAETIDDMPIERARNRRRQAELELEREAPRGETIDDLFPSEEARTRAIERRAARDVLEERAPGGTTLDEMILDPELRSQQIEQARARLFDRDSDATRSQAVSQQQTAALAAGTGAGAGETVTAAEFVDRDGDEGQDQRAGATATAPTDVDPEEVFAPPERAREATGPYGTPPQGEAAETADTPTRLLEASAAGVDAGAETTGEQTVPRGLQETIFADPGPGGLTATRFGGSDQQLRMALPDPDDSPIGFIPRDEEDAESWRTPIARSGEVLEELLEEFNGGRS